MREYRTFPSFDVIVRALLHTIQLLPRVFIIVDALDEYYVSSSQRAKTLLSWLFRLQELSNTNLFVTSLFTSDITSQFKEYVWKDIRAQNDDVLSYVDGRIPDLLASCISRYPEVQDEIRRDVVRAVDGMYVPCIASFGFCTITKFD